MLLLDELKFLASIGPLGVPVWVALKRVFISSLFIYTTCFTGPSNVGRKLRDVLARDVRKHGP